MGTSQSSNGSPAGVPMVPPWVPDLPLPDRPVENAGVGSDDQDGDQSSPERTPSNEPNQNIPIAPKVRFGGAKRSLGDYASTGEKSSMRKGLGQYVKKGYGGSAIATRRMASTAQAAHGLYSALAGGNGNPFTSDGGMLDSASMAGKTAYEIMDAVVEAVNPVDGTQDTEACRASMKNALADVLNLYPDADLMNLSEEQRDIAIERFVARDIFNRIDLDLGKHIRAKAINAVTAMSRLKEVSEYVREMVVASFKKLKSMGQKLTGKAVTQVVQSAIRETYEVFEGYAE